MKNEGQGNRILGHTALFLKNPMKISLDCQAPCLAITKLIAIWLNIGWSTWHARWTQTKNPF